VKLKTEMYIYIYIYRATPKRMKLQRRLSGDCLVRFLHSGFLVGQNWLISDLNHLINLKNTELKAETKNQVSYCHS